MTTPASIRELPIDSPAHRQTLALIAAENPDNRSEAELIAEDAEVLSTCLIALSRLPQLRRMEVLKFLDKRLGTAGTSYLNVLMVTAQMTESFSKELEQLRAENARFRIGSDAPRGPRG